MPSSAIAGAAGIVVALGCNIGPRRATLELACSHLEGLGVRTLRRSRLYFTRPWGYAPQPPFINAAILVHSALDPFQLLDRCHEVERRLGRCRTIRWGPRRIDLDLLLYRSTRMVTPRLTLPHPRLTERDFVLAPLMDLQVSPTPACGAVPWAALLHRIPPHQRSILHAQAW